MIILNELKRTKIRKYSYCYLITFIIFIYSNESLTLHVLEQKEK